MKPVRTFFNTHKPKSTAGIFQHILEQTRTASPGIALDLCCGTGKLTDMLSAQGYQAYGVDISDYFIGQEGTQAQGFVVADVARLPFASHSVNLICCVDSLQYFSDPAAILAEMRRVLQPGGKLILSTQNNYNPAGIKKWFIKKVTGKDWSPWLLHPIENFITYPWLLRTLNESGFEVEYVRGKQMLTAWISLLPSFIRNWSPSPQQSWRSLSAVGSRISFPTPIEESFLARFGMIVLVAATKQHDNSKTLKKF